MSSNSKKPENDNPLQIEKWQLTCSELRSAFHSWDRLLKLENTVSPDEKKCQDFKTLINDIKNQIKDFDH